jgi:uncharacterized repeat protein (TIGR01451 family)/fimbrial isopeptide formation D2 family protein
MRAASAVRRLGVGSIFAVLLALVAAPSALAAPAITLVKDAPDGVLYGETSPVTLRAANPIGQPYGYNLSFRDVLPPGVSYVPGSAPVAPQVIADAPAAGETTLIFSNVSDLSAGSAYELHYRVAHDTTAFAPGDDYTNQAGAYINDDARFVPDFAPDGTPAGDITGSATASATTDIDAIEILKDEPSPEDELLRGVHDHQTVYTLTVRNNDVEPTSGIDVEDWLPAGLEYLGCGTEDNSTGPEYAGAGALNPGHAPTTTDCLVPDLVETVSTDPDGGGPMPLGVYTHVVWNDLGAIAPNGALSVQYVAAVPLRANTTMWSGGSAPTPASLDQASNLDNNSGPETQDEQALTNYATAAGLFDGTVPVSDGGTLTRTAEDLAVQKSVDEDTISQGEVSTWSLRVRTSEYRYVDDVRVTDTVPDGLCPLGPANYEGGGLQTPECNPGGQNPSAPYTSVSEDAEGRYAIVWDDTTVPQLARMQPSASFTITFPTLTRAFYQQGYQNDDPVLTRDTWQNTVAVAGADFRICAPADPDCTGAGAKIDGDEVDGGDDLDGSAAGQEAGGLTIDKTVREATPVPVDCATGNYVDGPAPEYGPGDTVCWQLRIEFAALLDSGEPVLTDFLPPGVSYVGGSAAPTPANNVSSTFSAADAANGRLTWDLGSAVDAGSMVFEWRFATVVRQDASDVAGDVEGNLMKLAYENSQGASFPLRDQVDFVRSQARLDLVKGVRDVDDAPAAGNPPDTDGATVAAGDEVTFRIDLSNDGDLDAESAVVWDELQDGITCAHVDAMSDGGSCTGTRITWNGVTVGGGASHTLTYDVTMPPGVEPDQRYDDRAGIVSYTSDTNTGGSFTYVPANNIDPGAPAANAQAADDTSFVVTPAVDFQKGRTTAVGEAGNDGTSEATIGERIDYTATIIVPEGTTLYGSPVFTDDLGPRQTHVSPPVERATLNGGVLPGGFTLGVAGDVVTLEFPATYSNAAGSGDDTFEITFSATVDDVAANRRTAPNQTLTNVAGFAWRDQDSTLNNQSADVSTTIVEPVVAIAKDENDADDRVTPGQPLTYTLSITNPAGTRVSTAHDLRLVDHVPPGLSPTLPIADGGVWDSGADTITWTIPPLAPGAPAVTRSYGVTVDDPASAGSIFTNTADLTATSLAGAAAGERGPGSPVTAGYVAQDDDTVRLGEATLTKTAAPGSGTIGSQVTYTTTVTFPGSVSYFDATVLDTLPDGLVFDGTVDVTCDGGGACSPAVTNLTAEPQPDGTTRLGWFLGDLVNQPAARTYVISYRAHVADEYVPEGTAVVAGQTLTNVAVARYNGSDGGGTPPTIPSSGSFTSGSNTDDAVVTVIEPVVTLDKDVSGDANDDDVRPTQPGDSYTYSLVVRNTGTAPAYDLEVTDTPDAARLEAIAPIANPDAAVTDGDGSDGSLAWTIPGPIPVGASVTLQYTADLAPSAQLSDGDAVLNTADVTRFWGAPAAERAANPGRDYREYTTVPADTVRLDVRLPDLSVVKTTGRPGLPDSAVAEIGEPFPWRVTVRNQSTHAVAESVDVEDVLPVGWTYVAGSASLAPGGAVEPAIAGGTLTWSDVGDLAPGAQVVLSFQARPTLAATPGSNLNAASATAVDVSGAGSSADGPYTASDTAEGDLRLPLLTVAKTPDGASVDAGEQASYTVTVTNDGDVPARDVEVTDRLGVGQAYAAATATATPSAGFSETSVTAGPSAGETTIAWAIAQVPAHASVAITLPVDTDPSLPDASGLANSASVVSRERPAPVSDGGSYVTAVESDVRIVKTAQSAPVDAGEELDFTLSVTNDGPSDATGVSVQDVLPANLAFVSASAPCIEAAGTVTCAIGALAAGDSETLTLRARIDPDETSGVSNTATVSTTTPDSNPANDSSTANKPVGVEANVTVVKDGPAAPVLQGTAFDYTIRVANAGVSAATDVALSDPLPAGVTFDNVTTDTGTCSEAGGTVDCDFGTLQPGALATVTVRVNAVAVGAPLNVATATTSAAESTTADNDDDAPVTILPAADLGVTKTAPPNVAAGGQVDYELEVTNAGPSPATGVTLSDTLPPGVTFVSADPDCAHAGGVVTCDAGALAVSASRSFTVTVAVPFALGGQVLTNSVAVDGNEGDLVTPNDTAQAATTVGPAADLAVVKTAGGATEGATATWTIAVQNRGPSAAAPVTVTDTLPAGTELVTATPSQGACTPAGATFTCDLGTVVAGGAAQILVVTTVPAGTVGQQLRNGVTVAAPQPDPNPGDNADDATVVVEPPALRGANLVIEKTADSTRPQLGEPFRYRLLVRNVGDGTAERVRIVDTPNQALTVKRVTASQGKCSRDGAQIACRLGKVAAGEHAVVTLRVVPTHPGPIRNTASVVGGQSETVTANNVAVASVTVASPRARWRVAKRAARSAVRGGEDVPFAITVRTGSRAVAGARVCDRLPSGLVFVRARGARFRDGQACWTFRYLPPRSRRTVRVTARAERGFSVRRVRNVALARASNAGRRRAAAGVRVSPAFGGSGGGVTG